VSPPSADIYIGQCVNITATLIKGFSFSHWTASGGIVTAPKSAATCVTGGAGNVNVTAYFTRNNYTVTIIKTFQNAGQTTTTLTLPYDTWVSTTATIPTTTSKGSNKYRLSGDSYKGAVDYDRPKNLIKVTGSGGTVYVNYTCA